MNCPKENCKFYSFLLFVSLFRSTVTPLSCSAHGAELSGVRTTEWSCDSSAHGSLSPDCSRAALFGVLSWIDVTPSVVVINEFIDKLRHLTKNVGLFRVILDTIIPPKLD